MYSCLLELAEARKDYEEATVRCIQILELQRSLQNLSGITHYTRQLGFLYLRLGNRAEARLCLERCLDGYSQLGDLRGMAECLFHIAIRLPVQNFPSVCLPPLRL